MKLKLNAIAFGLAMAYAAIPAFAAPSADISQTSDSNVANIEQNGAFADTTAMIMQTGDVSNNGAISQTGTGGLTAAEVLQNGANNYALIGQSYGSNSTALVTQTANANIAFAYQSGDNHILTILQDSTGVTNVPSNYAYTEQSGSQNTADVMQTGANHAEVRQSSSANTAALIQEGVNNAYITQTSWGNQATVNQNGGLLAANTATVTQGAAVASIASVTQMGNANVATVWQH